MADCRNTMYERLTKRVKPDCLKPIPELYKEYAVTIKNEIVAFEGCFDNKDIYEDYRMALDRLCEIEDKICEGKIVELPCEIGDEKFAILPNTNVIVKGKVCTLIYQNGFLIDFGYAPDRFGGYTAYTQLLPEELFDTYEEAEVKVREVEGDNYEQR